MTFVDLDWMAIALRSIVYLATIAVAGSIFFRATLSNPEPLDAILGRQIVIGTLLLIFIEPIRYMWFEMQIAGGDPVLALSSSMRWMALEMPTGQAAAVRLLALCPLLAFGRRNTTLTLACAVALVASYLLEGHTLSYGGSRALVAIILFVHLALAHWWLASLLPLASATKSFSNAQVLDLVEGFSRLAIPAVGVLFVAGAVLLALFVHGTLETQSAYQRAFALKLSAFIAIFTVAAVNRLIWMPRIVRGHPQGLRSLRRAIAVECTVAAVILGATALATSFSPSDV